MDIEAKERLAHTGDTGQAACSIRLLAARLAFAPDLKQSQFAKLAGIKPTSYNNMERGLQFPNRAVLSYLYRAHRLDFNFSIAGLFAQLPGDVQEAIFPALADANIAWDQK